MILVTGATGRVGYHLLEQLADAEAPTTAMVRVEAKAEDLPTGVGHVVATLDAPPPAEVLQTFEHVFLLSPAHEGQAELEASFIDALVAAGHRPHVVKVARDGFQEPDCEVRFMRDHRLIATHLDATDLPVTYLAPSSYMENLLSSADTIRDQGTIFAPAGDGRIGFIAASDVAAAAAHALTGNGEQDSIHVLTGPEALSYTDVADRISAVFARQVGYEDVPPDQARETMLANGLPVWQTDGILELFEWIRNGGCDTLTNEVCQTTGQDPRPIEDWLSEMRGVFLGPRDVSPPRF
jgi:uncharacterized protein YbjT (DUF2867 family)